MKITGNELKKYMKIWHNVTNEPFDFYLYYDEKKCNTDNGILGYFSLLHTNNIYIANYSNMPDLMIPTIMHEYTHRKQYKKYGLLLYSLLALFRKWTLEPEAIRNEKYIAEKLNLAGY